MSLPASSDRTPSGAPRRTFGRPARRVRRRLLGSHLDAAQKSAELQGKLSQPGATATTPRLRIAVTGTRGLPATHGGVERAVESLARESALAGHAVTVYGRIGYCGEEQWFGAVRQVRLPTIAGKHLEALVHTMLSVLHILRHRRSYDLVHVHATGPVMIASVLRIAGIPMVATVHGLDWQREKWGRSTRFLLRVAARVAATVPNETIVVSEELQRHMESTYGRRPACIGNGVDFAELRGPMTALPEVGDQPFALFLGRLVPEKQVHLLIEAFAAIDTDCRLVIAGAPGNDQPYADRLEALAANDPRVVFVGPRYGAEKAWLLRSARAFVLPSTLEGLPIVALEALACGAQTIVSDIPQNLQAITIEGRAYGTTFRTGDAESLADALRPVLASAERLLPDASGVVDDRLDWAVFARQTEAVYARALLSSSRRQTQDALRRA